MTKQSLFFLTLLFCFSVSSKALSFNGPSPIDMPAEIDVKGKTYDLKNLQPPFPLRGKAGEQAFQKGSKVYFKRCFLCHGDLLNGKGLFGDSFSPAPANFIGKDTILKKSPAYVFWRIMKGGLGLPKKFEPWNSAMPAWENSLSEEEVWHVIAYIYQRSHYLLAIHQNKSKPSIKRGKALFQENCTQCHGDKGDGKGITVNYSSPPPRNLTKGQYKLRSTPIGKIPTDEDMFKTLTQGMVGTTMPGWKVLSEPDRKSLILYLKTIAPKFEKFMERGRKHKIVKVPEPPPLSLDSVKEGRQLYLENCSGCHGFEGRSDGEASNRIVSISSGDIWPRNLTKAWTFRRGSKRKDLFLTLRTGLYGSAMPRFSKRLLKKDQIWSIVNYVQTLSPPRKPKIDKLIHIKKIDGELPNDPSDKKWNSVDTHYYPLGGQVAEQDKAYFPMIESVKIKAVHNGSEVSILAIWDDPTFDPVLQKTISVKESPVPPIPEKLKGLKELKEKEPVPPDPQEFADSFAIQFPVEKKRSGEKPYFLNGDKENAVNIWQWNSYPLGVTESNSKGLGLAKPQAKGSQGVTSKAIYQYGQYQVVFKRKLKSSDSLIDSQFESNATYDFAFNAWDGSSDETGTNKSISSWFQFILE
jgi:mono/diheme cytochrome c family protein